MDSIHFRLPHNITQIMDMATQHGIFDSRSSGLRLAATYAILNDLPAQHVYDGLTLFNDIVKEFKRDASRMIQESLAGNSTPLEEYTCHISDLIATFPTFWQSYLWDTLRKIPEFKVIEQCLEMGKNV